MNSRQRKTLDVIFTDPASKTLPWDDLVSLLKSVGCRVIKKGGSAFGFEKNGQIFHAHKPHPQNTIKEHVVKGARRYLIKIGEMPK